MWLKNYRRVLRGHSPLKKNGVFLSVELYMEIPIESANSLYADSFNTLYKEALKEFNFV